MYRRAALFAGALALATGIGATGASVASAATLAKVKVAPGSKWSVVSAQVFCEVVTFHANGTFTSKNGPSGTWTGGGKTLTMTWPGTAGFTFSGTWSRVPLKEYAGTFNGNSMFPAQVEEGTGKC
jgi:hypothetical protein